MGNQEELSLYVRLRTFFVAKNDFILDFGESISIWRLDYLGSYTDFYIRLAKIVKPWAYVGFVSLWVLIIIHTKCVSLTLIESYKSQ